MGTFEYGDTGTRFTGNDRVLAHLAVVMITKLRRHEPFELSWLETRQAGSGRNSVWISPATPFRIQTPPIASNELNREWLERLMAAASSTQGLTLLPEDPDSRDEITFQTISRPHGL